MSLVKRLWTEDAGFVISTEAIIILTMLICAAIVGWQSIREAVVAELADIGDAIAALDQSYSFSGFTGHSASCSGSFFADNRDFCDDGDCIQTDGGFGRCIVLTGAVKEDAVVIPGVGDVGGT
jgi:hypothetical protein